MEKFCNKCKQVKPLEDYSKNKLKSDGLQTYCKICSRELNVKHYHSSPERRLKLRAASEATKLANRSFLHRYKRYCGCVVCNEKEPVALDLHHLDPSEKDGDPSNMVLLSRETLKKEVRKCIVLCANCHRKVHAGILIV